MDYQLLANGSEEDRESVTITQVRDELAKTVGQIEVLLEEAYEQVLLMGVLVGDEFHERKRRFKNVGQEYGYLMTYVRQVRGSNQFTFSFRRPSRSGAVFIRHIRMTSNKGYTKRTFRAEASHKDELNLCVETEAQFADLRVKGKIIKECVRKLRQVKGKDSNTNDEEF